MRRRSRIGVPCSLARASRSRRHHPIENVFCSRDRHAISGPSIATWRGRPSTAIGGGTGVGSSGTRDRPPRAFTGFRWIWNDVSVLDYLKMDYHPALHACDVLLEQLEIFLERLDDEYAGTRPAIGEIDCRATDVAAQIKNGFRLKAEVEVVLQIQQAGGHRLSIR